MDPPKTFEHEPKIPALSGDPDGHLFELSQRR